MHQLRVQKQQRLAAPCLQREAGGKITPLWGGHRPWDQAVSVPKVEVWPHTLPKPRRRTWELPGIRTGHPALVLTSGQPLCHMRPTVQPEGWGLV